MLYLKEKFTRELFLTFFPFTIISKNVIIIMIRYWSQSNFLVEYKGCIKLGLPWAKPYFHIVLIVLFPLSFGYDAIKFIS